MNIKSIVDSGLCTGCGVCISEDDTKQSRMVWNEDGFLIPKLGITSSQVKMVKVCPFYEKQIDEDYLGKKFVKNDMSSYDEKLGFYLDFYAGYSKEFRKTSSSGGLATYIFKSLLEKKIVDHLFVVKEKDGEYSYQFFSNMDEISQISKTRYTPVTLENLFKFIDEIDGKVAVSGVACFVKAIRLKQHQYPKLKEKIPFIVGIICGGLKSKLYTDYLARSAGCLNDYTSVEYRVKNEQSTASDYSFSCLETNSNKIHMVEMKTLGDMWGTGLFKSNACDYCDDVVTELADISLGDAWMMPYNRDGLGNNLIIVRTIQANKIIENGILDKELVLEKIDKEKVIESQQGSFNHRHNGLKYRVTVSHKNNIIVAKRRRFLIDQNFFVNKIQLLRMKVRSKSLNVWVKVKDPVIFRKKLKKDVDLLRLYSSLNRKIAAFLKIWSIKK